MNELPNTPEFQRQQRKALRELRIDKELLDELASHNPSDSFTKLGFKPVENQNCVAANKRRRLIVKTMYLSQHDGVAQNPPDKLPNNSITTYFVRPVDRTRCLVVQRMAKIDDKSRSIAREVIADARTEGGHELKNELFGTDTHWGNIGLLGSRAIVIDW